MTELTSTSTSSSVVKIEERCAERKPISALIREVYSRYFNNRGDDDAVMDWRSADEIESGQEWVIRVLGVLFAKSLTSDCVSFQIICEEYLGTMEEWKISKEDYELMFIHLSDHGLDMIQSERLDNQMMIDDDRSMFQDLESPIQFHQCLIGLIRCVCGEFPLCSLSESADISLNLLIGALTHLCDFTMRIRKSIPVWQSLLLSNEGSSKKNNNNVTDDLRKEEMDDDDGHGDVEIAEQSNEHGKNMDEEEKAEENPISSLMKQKLKKKKLSLSKKKPSTLKCSEDGKTFHISMDPINNNNNNNINSDDILITNPMIVVFSFYDLESKQWRSARAVSWDDQTMKMDIQIKPTLSEFARLLSDVSILSPLISPKVYSLGLKDCTSIENPFSYPIASEELVMRSMPLLRGVIREMAAQVNLNVDLIIPNQDDGDGSMIQYNHDQKTYQNHSQCMKKVIDVEPLEFFDDNLLFMKEDGKQSDTHNIDQLSNNDNNDKQCGMSIIGLDISGLPQTGYFYWKTVPDPSLVRGQSKKIKPKETETDGKKKIKPLKKKNKDSTKEEKKTKKKRIRRVSGQYASEVRVGPLDLRSFVLATIDEFVTLDTLIYQRRMGPNPRTDRRCLKNVTDLCRLIQSVIFSITDDLRIKCHS